MNFDIETANLTNMDRVNKILYNTEYNECLARTKKLEKERKFCRHNLKHFLDVARISYILNLERKLCIDKEIIYATALLHDIGRFRQYEENIPHEIASGIIAKDILIASDFNSEEISTIIEAIENHRELIDEDNKLGSIIYNADKLSRRCYCCKAFNECNWSEDKKNHTIKY